MHLPQRRFKPSSLARPSNLPLLGRTRLVAHLQQAATAIATPDTYPTLLSFWTNNPWPWIRSYLKGIFNPRYKPYPTYAAMEDTGIYPLRAVDGSEVIRIGIAGDWGTGTKEAEQISLRMQEFQPDYTIHLGDVYYVGDDSEVKENFLGKSTSQYIGVLWPRGRVGTFALVGNHEMYGGGAPYFGEMLGYCETGMGGKQRASFFALETPHWRIIGLDTGYNSVGTPVLGSIPGLKQLPIFRADCHLEDALLEWLRSNVDPIKNKKPTLLLSHHQYFSAFPDEAFPRPAEQLSEFFKDQEVVWIWGHEHRLAIYERCSPDGSLTCYGRCLGNGGMPVETDAPSNNDVPLAFYDKRADYPLGGGTNAGWNGFLNMTLDGQTLSLDYRDLNNQQLFAETFVGASDGSLQYSYQKPVPVLQPR